MFEIEKVDIPSKKTASGEDYWKINPKGYVPALQLDNGEVRRSRRNQPVSR